VYKLRTIAQGTIGRYGDGGGHKILMESFQDFEPRLALSKVRLAAKIRHSGEAAMSEACVAGATSTHSPCN